MGIFNSKQKKQEKERLLDREIIENRYDDLQKALEHQVGEGTHDTKRTVIEFPAHEVTVITKRGDIVYVSSSQADVQMSNLLYWSSLTEEQKNEIADYAGNGALNDSLLKGIAESFPYSVDFLQGAVSSSTLQNLLQTQLAFADYKSIRTELADVEVSGSMWALPMSSLNDELVALRVREYEARKALAINGYSDDHVSIGVTDAATAGATAAENFVLGAAAVDADLATAKLVSPGFLWADILEALAALKSSGAVALSLAGSPTEVEPNPAGEELPDLEVFEEPEVEPAMAPAFEVDEPEASAHEDPEDSDFTPTETLAVTDLEAVEAPEEKVETEASSPEEELNDVESLFPGTGAFGSLEELVNEAFAESFFRDEALAFSRVNDEQEAVILTIEETLLAQQASYFRSLQAYDTLRFDEQLSDYADVDEDGYSAEESAEIKAKREETNGQFFALHEAERARVEANNIRFDALVGLEQLSANSPTTETIELLEARLNDKIDAIEAVQNLAFHDPDEDAKVEVDPQLLEAAQETNAPELLVPHADSSNESTPLFDDIAKSLGLDPATLLS